MIMALILLILHSRVYLLPVLPPLYACISATAWLASITPVLVVFWGHNLWLPCLRLIEVCWHAAIQSQRLQQRIYYLFKMCIIIYFVKHVFQHIQQKTLQGVHFVLMALWSFLYSNCRFPCYQQVHGLSYKKANSTIGKGYESPITAH